MRNKDYTKFSAKTPKLDPNPTIEEIASHIEFEDPVTTEPPEEPLYGTVTDCAKLNVRKEPNSEADVLCTIDAKSEVVIVRSESTEEFHKVITAAGVEGFCMKKFITLVP